MSLFQVIERRRGSVVVLFAPASRKEQVERIARRLDGRKCDVTFKVSKSRAMIKIYL